MHGKPDSTYDHGACVRDNVILVKVRDTNALNYLELTDVIREHDADVAENPKCIAQRECCYTVAMRQARTVAWRLNPKLNERLI